MCESSEIPVEANKSIEHPLTVALIGCGPSGMFFLHALAARRKELMDRGDLEAVGKLPIVTCYEKASSPGGVWRFERDDQAVNSTNMYEGLWINSPKEGFELFDYTFDEHFKCPKPAFLPRQEVFEYFMARVVKHEDIFQYVQFNTSVESVTYDNDLGSFEVRTKNDGADSISTFDRCIWAAGINGKPKFINSIVEDLEGFQGEIVHSSHMNRLESKIEGKRILMIGSNFSAEDLALQCTKLGCGKIYITSRTGEGFKAAEMMGCWPRDNVEVLEYRVPSGVRDGTTIICRCTYEDDDDPDESSSSDDDDSYDEPKTIEVNDIDVIIFCTGYHPSSEFLDESLNPWRKGAIPTWKAPQGWRMDKNIFSKDLGHVKPSKKLLTSVDLYGYRVYEDVLLKSNPKMMFITEQDEAPLLEIDVIAHLTLRYLLGEIPIPTEKEMMEELNEDCLDTLNCPLWRVDIDKNYDEALWELPKDHWYTQWRKYRKYTDGWKEFLKQQNFSECICLGEKMLFAKYPACIVDEENPEKLNDLGMRYLNNYSWDERQRIQLQNCRGTDAGKWKTFRDMDMSYFSSAFTGTVPIPLKGRWMDLDNEGNPMEQKNDI